MSPASYLAAPPRVAPGIIPPAFLVFWVALTVFILAPLLALAYLATQAVGLWRAFRSFTRAFGSGMAELGARVDALGARELDVERLGPSVERLRLSTAQLSLLLNALGRVREQWSALLAVYPRK